MNIFPTPTCYYPLDPPDKATIDASGHVKGKDLRDTRGYERFVDVLSKDHNSSTPAAAQDRQEAQAAVDRMKIKAGTILMAPCHHGHTAADRTPPSHTAQSDPDPVPAPRARRAIPADATEKSAGTCATASLWQRMFDAIAQFIGGVAVLSNSNTATALLTPDGTTDKAGKPCPADDISHKETDNDVRDYERYLQAWAVSASA